jgi:uncharacterized protein
LIYRLEIENFCSVRERQVLDLSVSERVSDPDGRYAPIFEGSKVRAPKAIAIFGANASGKTTILKALDLITAFARYYPLNVPGGFNFDSFNDGLSFDAPVKLAIELGGVMNLDELVEGKSPDRLEQGVYRYELEFVRSAGSGFGIGREALFQRPAKAAKWRRMFDRQGQTVKGPAKDNQSFSLSGYSRILDKLPPNASVIATLAEFQHGPSKWLTEASKGVFNNLRFSTGPEQDVNLVSYLANDPELVSQINRDIRQIDLGLDEMRVQQTSSGPVAMFRHDGLLHELPWFLQSHGTRSVIRLLPLLASAIQKGGVAIIDEIDAQLHPLLLPRIVEWFYGWGERNEHDAQLWFSCHSASLLDVLSKEEIVICEKDRLGRTEVFGLSAIKDVGRGDNFSKKYLGGVYGGVPQFG